MRIPTSASKTTIALLALFVAVIPAAAQKKYGPGVSDSEIKIGQTMAYSGPASLFGTVGKAEAAYFEKVNAEGGINGRKIRFISLDDGYSPPKTVEHTRRLVEQDEVLLIFGSLGTPSNIAIQKYLNQKKVPHLFIAGGASRFGDPANFPWTMGWQPNFRSEGRVYAQYVLTSRPNAKIGVLYQNDDYGKDFLNGFKEALAAAAATKAIVAELSYELSDATIDSQMFFLKNSGADTFLDISSAKFAAQAIRKARDIDWRPLHVVVSSASSVGAVLKPAGLENSVGLITAAYLKEPNDAQWKDDPAMKEWFEWMRKYFPEGNTADWYNVYGYASAQTLAHVLQKCGDDLTRENVMRQAANIKDLALPIFLPGIRANTTAQDYYPIEQMRLQRFDGRQWVLFGPVLGK